MSDRENKQETSWQVAKANEWSNKQQNAVSAQAHVGKKRVQEHALKRHIPFVSGHASIQGKRQNVSEPYR
jgi:hypothetical protein